MHSTLYVCVVCLGALRLTSGGRTNDVPTAAGNYSNATCCGAEPAERAEPHNRVSD